MTDFSAIRGLAFDLDGTLVNSAPGLAQAVDLALQELALPAAGEARITAWIGNGADVLVERALRWAGEEPDAPRIQALRALFDKHYARTAVSGSALFPQVKETLAQLAARGLPLAVVTNKPTPFVAPMLVALGIGDDFSLIIGGDDVAQRKPHPAPLYLVLGKLGLRAHELLFVGDSRNDIQAAQAAGCPCVGLSYGYNYGEAIALSRPDAVLDSFADLLPIIEQSGKKHE